MTDTIFLTGIVATSPRHVTTNEGLAITSFRLASSQRRFDRQQQKWVDGETNWFTVSAFRQLATNAADSVTKGDRVVVTGRLHVRDWESTERSGTNVEIEADALGHDLTWGTSIYNRNAPSSPSASSAQTDGWNSGGAGDAAHQPDGPDASGAASETTGETAAGAAVIEAAKVKGKASVAA
jgi:single-strand DNA-binding protein